ncbi:MAG TPA: 2-amino-4-hydroxy-6-hydroxymethyldihydropteridine diphosphokinase [Chitinophagaceae bacterium]|nr:2-amino-4-hydroxy-6-hydroxymethyldihydropteridine diphosphokinase [Chitinophagaceae bacterium]
MNTAYLLIGGNLGRKKDNLLRALELIEENCGIIQKKSAIYDTAAWGHTDQPSFLNQVLEIQTSLNSRQLIRKILKLEKLMGRVRKEKLAPRIIDIDILFYNQEVNQLRFLITPHPEMQNRRFVLVPLAEIAPNLIHPVLKKKISQLLTECEDKSDVKVFSE